MIKTKPTDSKSHKGLLASSLVVSGMTLLSRIMGMVRDVVIAASFGAGASADAFFVAFKIPNFLRRLFAEGAFSQAFIPVLAEVQQSNTDLMRAMVGRVAGSLGLVLILVTVVAILLAPLLVMLFAPGFIALPAKFDLTVQLLRLTFPYLLLISLTAFAGSLLNAHQRFAVPAFTPVLLNLSLIVAVLWLAPRLAVPIMAMAWGVLAAGFVQLAFQLPFLAQLGLLVWPQVDFNNHHIRKIMQLMLPALFGISVSQINLMLDTVLASLLQTGSISWLYYSDRLVELPLGVFGIAIATVLLPSLSRQYTKASKKAFSATLDWALRMVLLIGLPATLALELLAEPLIITLFYYGEMTARDVVSSAASLKAYAFGLLAFMFIKVLAPGYFARQDMRTPVRIGIWAMLSNMILNVILVWYLVTYNWDLAHVGLALATALSAFVNAALLAWGLYRLNILKFSSGWLLWWLRLLIANAALIGFILWLQNPLQQWLEWGLWQRVWQLAQLTTFGGLVYVTCLWLFGVRLYHLSNL